MDIVSPKDFSGHGFSWNLNLFSGPKFDIKCGKCEHTFSQRLPLISYPTVLCPACKTLNKMPIVFGED